MDDVAATHARWDSLDATDDPNWFIRFLDVSRGHTLALIEQDPAAFFAFLDPKPGHAILEVGSGTGSTLHALARLVAPGGRIVGLDYSMAMVEEATRRAEGIPIEFIQGDAANLPFPDNTFDRASSNIVFQHLPNPAKGLSEMVRVTRRGGLVTIMEQDWETLVVDASDEALNRTILNAFCDEVKNRWIGRQLFGLFKDAGLADVTVTVSAQPIAGVPWDRIAWFIEPLCDAALRTGAISDAQKSSWVADQRARADAGKQFAAFNYFRATGVKA